MQWKGSGWVGFFLQKPDGGVRGIVGRRRSPKVGRQDNGQTNGSEGEAATAPFQYAFTTNAGCESVAHIFQSLTDQDERATIVSIDVVGAYD